jgi:hypothetical protein
MQTALKTTTKVLAGGKIEIVAPQLPPDEIVEVIIVFSTSQESLASTTKKSAMDILREASGHRIFKTAEDVETYLTEERDTWDG